MRVGAHRPEGLEDPRKELAFHLTREDSPGGFSAELCVGLLFWIHPQRLHGRTRWGL